LIDELDKAPRDTPNDLLSEIEDMEFRIPEGSLVLPPNIGV
jgi:MoxR-like ATPase